MPPRGEWNTAARPAPLPTATASCRWRPPWRASALSRATDAPIWIAGYSFGAAVGLDVAHPRIDGWLAVAPPLAVMPGARVAASDHRPKHLLIAGHDQFSPPEATTDATRDWRNTTSTVLGTADHFLAGHLGAVNDWARAIVIA